MSGPTRKFVVRSALVCNARYYGLSHIRNNTIEKSVSNHINKHLTLANAC